MMNQVFSIKEFKEFVTKQTERLSDHAKAIAGRANRPYLYLYTHRDRKDDMAEEIACKDRVTSGLICVFGVVEPCQSSCLPAARGDHASVGAQRKCLCFYYYFIDREWGMMHVRIQSVVSHEHTDLRQRPRCGPENGPSRHSLRENG